MSRSAARAGWWSTCAPARINQPTQQIDREMVKVVDLDEPTTKISASTSALKLN
jgi:hypothetical protein